MRERLVSAHRRAAPVRAALARAGGTFTPASRAVAAIAAVSWLLGWRLGWDEMMVVAATCLVLLVVCALFMIGRTSIDVRLSVEPPRVTVGESVTGSVDISNSARSPLLPVRLELPVGEGGVSLQVPLLAPGGTHSELFVVPTHRRGVINVGPVSSVRGDPVGLFRRDTVWSAATEIFVHPVIVPLEPLGAGLMRDLEGATSERTSQSDLAFHALREYIPGDDLRHVHWRSSARHGTLLVRQYLDTRRSHLTVVVDSRPDAYGSEGDYETALSVAGSLMVRAWLDEYDVSFLSGTHASSRAPGRAVLDGCARAEPQQVPLVEAAAKAFRLAPDTSFVFVVTGPHTDFLTAQRAVGQFPVEVGRAGIRVDSEAEPSLRSAGDLRLLTLGSLSDLPVLLRWGL